MSKPLSKRQLKGFYQDLMDKMDYEGGMNEYFLGYGHEEGNDAELDRLVATFSNARDELSEYLSERCDTLKIKQEYY